MILPLALIAGWIFPEWIILGLAIGNEHEVTGYPRIQAIAAGSSVACLLWAIVARPRQDESPDAAAKAWAGAVLAAAAWGVIVISEIARYS